jgi:DNA-binding NtrC family response regulator
MIPKTILVVDDEEAVRNLLKRALSGGGVDVLVADSVASAERLLEHHRVDLVLCDNQLSDEDGLAFLGRTKDQYPDMTRVLITGKLDHLFPVAEIDRARLDYCFLKPLEIAEMRHILTELLQGHLKPEAATPRTAVGQSGEIDQARK